MMIQRDQNRLSFDFQWNLCLRHFIWIILSFHHVLCYWRIYFFKYLLTSGFIRWQLAWVMSAIARFHLHYLVYGAWLLSIFSFCLVIVCAIVSVLRWSTLILHSWALMVVQFTGPLPHSHSAADGTWCPQTPLGHLTFIRQLFWLLQPHIIKLT